MSDNNNNNNNNNNPLMNILETLFNSMDTKNTQTLTQVLAECGNLASVVITTRLADGTANAKSEWVGFSPLGWAISEHHSDFVKCFMKHDGLLLSASCSPTGRTPLGEATFFIESSDNHSEDPRALDTLDALVEKHPLYRDASVVKQHLVSADISKHVIRSNRDDLLSECKNPVVVRALLEFEVSCGYLVDSPESEVHPSFLSSMTNPGLDDLVTFLTLNGAVIPLWSEHLNWDKLSKTSIQNVTASNSFQMELVGDTPGYRAMHDPEAVRAAIEIGGGQMRYFFLQQVTFGQLHPSVVSIVRESGFHIVDIGTWLLAVYTGRLPVAKSFLREFSDQLTPSKAAHMVRVAVNRQNLPMLNLLVSEWKLEVNYATTDASGRDWDETAIKERPLDNAVKLGWLRGVQILLDAGATPKGSWTDLIESTENEGIKTLLMQLVDPAQAIDLSDSDSDNEASSDGDAADVDDEDEDDEPIPDFPDFHFEEQ